ncbi:MAG TPA: tetratricopeptide repeat protein [Terriglobales bacterium]|nr:tetratricopeptide repeat protein [Terriglobales bacterium]
MRAFVIFFCFTLPGALAASAEVIHLKNGRTIWADHVHENGSRIEYDLGDDTYGIPKASVDHIEAGGIRPQYASPSSSDTKGAAEVPVFSPSLDMNAEVADKIIVQGQIDPDALDRIEKQNNPKMSAAAFFTAGKFEFDHGNFAKSKSYFDSALRMDPDNPSLLNYYAALLVRTGNAKEGIPYAERAVRIAPESPDALAVLGYAQFGADRTRDAVRTWKHSLALRPDTALQAYLAKAERDATAEADFSEKASSHFTLRYEGAQTSETLRRDLITTLEASYEDLVRELGVAPRNSIPVVLYTGQAFFDVTQAPSWSGAVNDGKLRIPIEGLTSVTPELTRVLKHELAHSFINYVSGGRCPQWLHEGIAQAVEPKLISGNGRRLAQLFATQHEIPFNALEGSFMRFSGVEATLAYDESLAAVQYINETYGLSDLRRVLERLGQGSSTEAALRATIHTDYGQLETEVGKYLISRYGN